MSRAGDRGVLALQQLLAGEHAVVYGYGVAGARLRGPARDRAERGWTAHRARRAELVALVEQQRGTPVPPAGSYALPFPVRSAADARRLLTLLEERAAVVWADAVADLDADLRRYAARGLADAAVAASRWRGASTAFPGLPERAEASADGP